VRKRPRAGEMGSIETWRSPAPVGSAQACLPTVLLSVSGLTPQVITETLYCLLVSSHPPVPVREIRVITTRPGRERVKEQLLHPVRGQFHGFCRDYGITRGEIKFDTGSIIVPTTPDGHPLEDVRTPAENVLVADSILSLVRDLTRDPNTALHCSVAGGRKTMGLFIGIAFQLFARPQDRLSHVLVRPPAIEGHAAFFYPPPRRTCYEVDGRRVRSQDVRVELAEIPVLLLREKAQAADLEKLSYSVLIAGAQHELNRLAAPPAVLLDPVSRSLRIESGSVRLTPLEFALYSLFARRRAVICGKPSCPGCEQCSLEARAFLDTAFHQEILALLEKLGPRDERARTLPGWTKDGDERFIGVRSRLNRKIRDALGPGRWVTQYQINSRRTPGALSRYAILLEPSRIIFA